jgi:hypothetical protein
MWDIEEPGRKTSSALRSKAGPALAIIHLSVSRVWVTPFAGPVLPEVKKITAGASGSRSTAAGTGSLPSSSPKSWPQSAPGRAGAGSGSGSS